MPPIPDNHVHNIFRIGGREADLKVTLRTLFQYIIEYFDFSMSIKREMKRESFDISNERKYIYSLIDVFELENSLASKNPHLTKEWHPIKNGNLKPEHVSSQSGKRVWWTCTKGHEWETAVCNRSKKNTNCPYCSGNKVSLDNCLATINPQLAQEWHPSKNKITPQEVTANSNKQVWWCCPKGHEWKTGANARSQGKGCPYCAGRYATPETCFASVYPDLAKEWHPLKNGELTPYNVTKGSNRSVWWRCSEGHEWKEKVIQRVERKRRQTGSKGQCLYCCGKKVSLDNCLATVRPDLIKQWHPTKNGELTPYDVKCDSSKKAWWIDLESGEEFLLGIRSMSARKRKKEQKSDFLIHFSVFQTPIIHYSQYINIEDYSSLSSS